MAAIKSGPTLTAVQKARASQGIACPPKWGQGPQVWVKPEAVSMIFRATLSNVSSSLISVILIDP